MRDWTTDGVDKSDSEDPAAETTVLLHDKEADVPGFGLGNLVRHLVLPQARPLGPGRVGPGRVVGPGQLALGCALALAPWSWLRDVGVGVRS